MRKIEPENIKVGDLNYLIDKKRENIRYIIKKTPNEKNRKHIFEWWLLKDKSKKTHLFEPIYFGMDADISERELKAHTIYKLNKKEVLKFTKLLILKNLK